jgi:disulfide bond formation protein DsbB
MLDLETMKLFFAMLTLVTNVVVIAYVLLVVAAVWSKQAAQLKRRFHELIDGYELLLAAVVAGTATLGSLYLSEIADLPPCRLCWFQRLIMYPTAVALAIAAWKRFVQVRIPIMIEVIVGAGVAFWHYLLQYNPSWQGTSCSLEVPCAQVWFRVLGFISIPYMALSAFLFVLVMMIALGVNQADVSRHEQEEEQEEVAV